MFIFLLDLRINFKTSCSVAILRFNIDPYFQGVYAHACYTATDLASAGLVSDVTVVCHVLYTKFKLTEVQP